VLVSGGATLRVAFEYVRPLAGSKTVVESALTRLQRQLLSENGATRQKNRL